MKWLAGVVVLVTAFLVVLLSAVLAPASSGSPTVNDTARMQMPVGCGGC